MESTFDPKNYLYGLGVELVNAFDLAGKTTHPQSVGSGREKSSKEKSRMPPNAQNWPYFESLVENGEN